MASSVIKHSLKTEPKLESLTVDGNEDVWTHIFARM
jgi:hypothetical protein